jgi:hypothetical protein
MPGPFSALSKVEKADIGRQLEETIEVDGRIIKKGDLLEFEIEKGLGFGKSQEDIMKKLKQQGIDVAPNYVKQRMAVARGRKPIKGDRPDPRYAKMEANYIIQRELDAGKTWEEISSTLLASGFNGPKLTEVARNNYTKKMQQQSPPAVIDQGEVAGIKARLALARERYRANPTADNADEVAFVNRLLQFELDGKPASNTEFGDSGLSGPNAGEDQPPVFDPEAEAIRKNRQVLDDSEKTDEQWQTEFREIGIQAGRLREQAKRDLRGKSEEEIAASPWMAKMEEMVRSLRDSIIPTGARAMQGSQTTVPENLDVPVAPAGIDGPVEPEFRNR